MWIEGTRGMVEMDFEIECILPPPEWRDRGSVRKYKNLRLRHDLRDIKESKMKDSVIKR